MRKIFLSLGLVAAIGFSADVSFASSTTQTKTTCKTKNCGKKTAAQPQPHYQHRHITLDGTEPICGFNDGTYLHNWLGCGIFN